MQLRSDAFDHQQPIPKQYTGDGEDISPPLTWSEVPDGTKSLALICDDPDAPMDEPFVHWVAYGMPADAALPEGIDKQRQPASPPGIVQGTNSFGRIGYNGPAPPEGHGTRHRLLDTQNVLPGKGEAPGPLLRFRVRLDQGNPNAQAVRDLLHRPLDEVFYGKPTCNLGQRPAASCQREGRRAGSDMEAGNASERVEHFLCQPFTEVLVFSITSDTAKGEHSDTGTGRDRDHLRVESVTGAGHGLYGIGGAALRSQQLPQAGYAIG